MSEEKIAEKLEKKKIENLFELEKRTSALEKLSLKEWKHVIDLKIGEHIEKLKEVEDWKIVAEKSLNAHSRIISELEQKINFMNQVIDARTPYFLRIDNLEAVLRELILTTKATFCTETTFEPDEDYQPFLNILDKLGSEDVKRWCACGDEILIEGDKCETCKFMEKEERKERKTLEDEMGCAYLELTEEQKNKHLEAIEKAKKEKEPSEEDDPCVVCKMYPCTPGFCEDMEFFEPKSPASITATEDGKMIKGFHEDIPAEDKYQIDGIEYHREYETTLVKKAVEREREELIADFIEKLENLIKKHECEFNEGYFAVETGYIEDIIEEYEEARKNP